jgi:hypothetical protein
MLGVQEESGRGTSQCIPPSAELERSYSRYYIESALGAASSVHKDVEYLHVVRWSSSLAIAVSAERILFARYPRP